ncbi:hypothetical protein DPEC_G00184900 [Dallia pectoralis]|uniref:Uncharacterized protein n=1 Tax=Dallia pectoralis TaxID=75939 RepID=A0ACC2GB55_DALPE|nr:hypothetical protein DPEC_G00184900 [Dallia pectoralis]
MELCNQFRVHGLSSLYVTGIDEAYSDDDITEFFKVNGDIKKVVRVPDDPEQPRGRALIEYTAERVISRLDPIQLGSLPSPNDPAVTWCVKTVRELCQEELGRELAQKCLAELSSLAEISKAGFWGALQGELQSALPHAELAPPQSPDTQLQPSDNPVAISIDGSSADGNMQTNHDIANPINAATRTIPTTATWNPILDEGTVNPPHVQKVIVEHFIRESKENIESLLSPAADIVKPLGTNATPQAYLTQLESAFGVVEDGEELFATFLGSNQNSGEKPSVYLSRLQTLLTKAVTRGGVSAAESDKYLLRQFCRGCWDQSLIIGLQLEHRRPNPPTFPELLLLLRTEEDRRAAKMDRMKKHLGSTKAAAHVHSVINMPVFDPEAYPTTTKEHETDSRLEKEVAELRMQVAKLIQQGERGEGHKGVQSRLAQSGPPAKTESLLVQASNRDSNPQSPTPPKPWFCFKCGGDGHITAKCTFEPNPGLVRKKNAELKEKRSKFWARQAATKTSLNF